MKIGVIADTHMPHHAKRLPQALRKGLSGVDLIIHAGDWQTLDVYEELRMIAPVKGVSGNVDGEDIVYRFRSKEIVKLENFRIGVVHGHVGRGKTTPERARTAFSDQDVDLIIFGHSHIPFDEDVNGVRLFNPGSPTDKRRQPRFSYGLFTLEHTIEAEHFYYLDKT